MDNLNSTLVSLEEICRLSAGLFFGLYHLVKADNVTPVFIMNLLISDFIQIIGRIVEVIINDNIAYIYIVILIGVSLSVGFMVCIALERYLLVVHPLWYRCHRTIKHSILISLVICAFVVLIFTGLFFLFYVFMFIGVATLLILPLPLLLFFLGATWRALSHSISVPHKEKKRILGTLALVLLLYLILFLSTTLLIFLHFFEDFKSQIDFWKFFTVAFVFLYISPLIDPLLYILIKKDAKYIVKVPHCYWRLRGHRENRQTSSVPTENITSV
ncbi:mas-related G-protein coupled receptor member A1-like [Anguilla anguilla]|uniref:mas-related G-protein coupled receptor member A1-like n=1 Tax=Anguilla anguilla TaxID=7936 RepID=UPI0015A9FB39|nr:mas-related G-protein coupled receptor member A1-like [Anguilla anguilla]